MERANEIVVSRPIFIDFTYAFGWKALCVRAPRFHWKSSREQLVVKGETDLCVNRYGADYFSTHAWAFQIGQWSTHSPSQLPIVSTTSPKSVNMFGLIIMWLHFNNFTPTSRSRRRGGSSIIIIFAPLLLASRFWPIRKSTPTDFLIVILRRALWASHELW